MNYLVISSGTLIFILAIFQRVSFIEASHGINLFAAPKTPVPCPSGQIVNCFVDPCLNAICLRFPDATCVPNFCDGCNADFFVNKNLVDCDTCPPGIPLVNCFVDPCKFATCEAFPDAKCVSDYCGGCFAHFFVGNQKVNCSKSSCPPDLLVDCIRDPCTDAICLRYPKATCVPNYCGGCNTNFFVKGNPVTCDGFCPLNQVKFECFVNPCEVITCPAYPNSTCVPDYCSGCSARFFQKGREIKCKTKCKDLECLKFIKCAFGVAHIDKCPTCTCKQRPIAIP